jgi:hypothetical protein
MNYLNRNELTPPPVTVIDSIMGSGKTTWIIDHMNRSLGQYRFNATGHQPRFIYVTPLLDETDRIRSACPLASFKNPVPRHGSKFFDFKTLLQEGQNIATTHALFSQLDRECYDLIEDKGYTLVIDEALSCLEIFADLTKADRELLFGQNMVYVEKDTSKLRWNHQDYAEYRGRFEQIKSLCDNGNLVVYNADGNRTVLIWEFAVDFIYSCKEVFILTYLYQGSPMSLYLAMEGINVDYNSIQVSEVNGVVTRAMVPHDMVNEAAIKAKLRSLITVYDGPKNSIGDRKLDTGSYPFTSSWFESELKKGRGSSLSKVKNTVRQFFEYEAKTPSKLNGWTCLSKGRKQLEGSGYTKGFIPINSKATNQYAEKTSLAYVANVYYQTIIKQFFQSREMIVFEDLYALSEMVQWVFRSAIRNDKPISIFIPSPRMRGLFIDWLNADRHTDLVEKIEEERNERVTKRLKAVA